MNYSVDEIDGGIAVLTGDDGELREVPSATLAPNVKEGDVVNYHDFMWQVNAEETQSRARRIQALLRCMEKDRRK